MGAAGRDFYNFTSSFGNEPGNPEPGFIAVGHGSSARVRRAAALVDLASLIEIEKRVVRVSYEVSAGEELGPIVISALKRKGLPDGA